MVQATFQGPGAVISALCRRADRRPVGRTGNRVVAQGLIHDGKRFGRHDLTAEVELRDGPSDADPGPLDGCGAPAAHGAAAIDDGYRLTPDAPANNGLILLLRSLVFVAVRARIG